MNARRIREVALVAGLLAVGVVAWEHVLHAYLLGHTDTVLGNLRHIGRDVLLSLPVAVAATGLGLVWSRLLRLGGSVTGVAARGALTALLFGLLLVPAAPIHNWIDVAPGASQPLAATQLWTAPQVDPVADEHAGHLGLAPDAGLVQLEVDQSAGGQMLHGAHDALIGEVVALPLAIGGLLALALPRLLSRRRLPEVRVRVRWVPGRRLSVTGAALLVTLGFAGTGHGGSLLGVPALAANDPCASSTTPTKMFNVSAINVRITLNHFGDNDPGGFMYVLDQSIPAVRAQEAAATVTTGLREDPIQPLVLRANLGDCFRVHDRQQGDLEALPGVPAPPAGAGFPQLTHTGAAPPAATTGGSPCPAGAPSRAYAVSAFDQPLPMDGTADASGVVYALTADEAAVKSGALPTAGATVSPQPGFGLELQLHLCMRRPRQGSWSWALAPPASPPPTNC